MEAEDEPDPSDEADDGERGPLDRIVDVALEFLDLF